MNKTIGIYDNHDLALTALKSLLDSGFPVSQLSIMGIAETEDFDNKMNSTPKSPLKVAGLGAGVLIGATIGLLTGIGFLAIPGLGLVYGAGALAGTVAGLDFGIIGGGIASVIATLGIKDENAVKYHTALEDGKFLVIVHGNETEINKAKEMLLLHGTHNHIEAYL